MDIGECGVCGEWAGVGAFQVGIVGQTARRQWTTLFVFGARRKLARSASSVDRLTSRTRDEEQPNETKLSHRWQGRAWQRSKTVS